MRFSFEKQYPDKCSNVREERGQYPALGKQTRWPGSYYKRTDFLLSVRMYLINPISFTSQIFLLLNRLFGQHFPSITLPLLVIVVYLCRFFFNPNFLVVLRLCCCVWAFSGCSEWGLLFVAVHGFSLQWLLLGSTGSRHVG